MIQTLFLRASEVGAGSGNAVGETAEARDSWTKSKSPDGPTSLYRCKSCGWVGEMPGGANAHTLGQCGPCMPLVHDLLVPQVRPGLEFVLQGQKRVHLPCNKSTDDVMCL